jgi:hypothetical protein
MTGELPTLPRALLEHGWVGIRIQGYCKIVVLEVYRKAPNVALMGGNLVSNLSSSGRWRALHIESSRSRLRASLACLERPGRRDHGYGPRATFGKIPLCSHATQNKEKKGEQRCVLPTRGPYMLQRVPSPWRSTPNFATGAKPGSRLYSGGFMSVSCLSSTEHVE